MFVHFVGNFAFKLQSSIGLKAAFHGLRRSARHRSLSPQTLSLGTGVQDPHICQAGRTEELRAAVQEKRLGGGITLSSSESAREQSHSHLAPAHSQPLDHTVV